MSALRFPYAVTVLASADDFHHAFQYFLLARACSLSNDASYGGQEIACLFFSAEEHVYCCFGFPQVQEGRQHRPRCHPLQPVGPPGCHVSPSRQHRLDIGWLTDGSARADRVCHHGVYLPSFWRVQQERHVEWMMNSILNVDALTSAMFRAPA